MVDSISKAEAQGVYGNPEIDVTNKVAVLIYPMVIAMAHGKLRIDYSALSKSYFGTVVSRLIKEWDRRSTLRVVSGQWQWSFGHDPYSIDKGDNVVTINSHLNDETEYAVDTTVTMVTSKSSLVYIFPLDEKLHFYRDFVARLNDGLNRFNEFNEFR